MSTLKQISFNLRADCGDCGVRAGLFDSIERFLMSHGDSGVYFLTQTFGDSSVRGDEQAARALIAPFEKCLARYGEFLTVWERGVTGNAIHAHFVFATGKIKAATERLKRLMSPVGILACYPIRHSDFRAVSGYMSGHSAKRSIEGATE
jgi:hypothetical protein